MSTHSIETIEIENCVCGLQLKRDFLSTIDYSYQTCANKFRYTLCTCGSYVLRNRPVEASLPTIYPVVYDAYIPSNNSLTKLVRKLNFARKLRVVKKYSQIQNWIDFGSGAGEFALVLKKLGVLDVYAIDKHESPLMNLNISGVHFLNETLLSQISDKSIDAVSILQVIEHLANPSETMNLLKSKLKIGGVLILETPSPSGLDFKIGVSGTWGGWHAPRHFYVFSTECLVKLLEGIGFKVLEVSHIPSPYLWAETLKARRLAREKNPMRGIFTISNPLFIVLIAFFDFTRLKFGKKTSNQRIIAMKEHS